MQICNKNVAFFVTNILGNMCTYFSNHKNGSVVHIVDIYKNHGSESSEIKRNLLLVLQEVFKPKQLFRGGPESAMLKGLTAEDVLKYEQEELGNKDVVPEPGIDFTKIKSENLAWLAETEDQAREYGEVSKLDLKDYRVIARDSEGGVLVEKLKSSKQEPTSKGMAKAEMARMCQRRLKTYKMLGYEVRKFDEPLEHGG